MKQDVIETVETVLDDLIGAGIIQFGHWINTDQEQAAPIRLNFELLPSYPHLLEQTGRLMSAHAQLQHIQRLVCHQNSLALAVCISLQIGIPLVYERHNTSGSHSLVGAYDIGHSTMLIGDIYSPEAHLETGTLKAHAARVGLNITSELYMIGLVENAPTSAQCLAVINADLISRWVSQRWITIPQGNAIQHWLQQS